MALCYPSQLYKTSRMPKNIPSPTQAWVSLTGSYSLWYIIQCLYSYSYSFKIISQLIWSLQKCPISLYSSEDSHWLKGFAISTSSDHAVLSLIRLLIMNMFIKITMKHILALHQFLKATVILYGTPLHCQGNATHHSDINKYNSILFVWRRW